MAYRNNPAPHEVKKPPFSKEFTEGYERQKAKRRALLMSILIDYEDEINFPDSEDAMFLVRVQQCDGKSMEEIKEYYSGLLLSLKG